MEDVVKSIQKQQRENLMNSNEFSKLLEQQLEEMVKSYDSLRSVPNKPRHATTDNKTFQNVKQLENSMGNVDKQFDQLMELNNVQLQSLLKRASSMHSKFKLDDDLQHWAEVVDARLRILEHTVSNVQEA